MATSARIKQYTPANDVGLGTTPPLPAAEAFNEATVPPRQEVKGKRETQTRPTNTLSVGGEGLP